MDQLIKLRPFLDFARLSYEGKEFIVIRCLLNLLENPIVLDYSLQRLLYCLYYGVARSDINKILGSAVSNQDIELFLKFLEDNTLLESSKWLEKFNSLKTDYFNLAVRPSYLEGIHFSSVPEERRQTISSFLNQSSSRTSIVDPDVVIIPHIDYKRGWEVYAKTINSIAGFQRKRKAIFLGTDHKATTRLLSVSNKSYSIADCVFRNDLSKLQVFVDKCGEWVFEDMFNQKTEHSIEITLPFLEPVWNQQFNSLFFSVGSIEQNHNFEHLRSWGDFSGAVRSLTEVVKDDFEETVFILSIDFSHLGKAFGDPFEIDSTLLQQTKDFDYGILNSFCSHSARDLFDNYVSMNFKQKACGFSSLTLLRSVLDNLSLKIDPKIEYYHQTITQDNNCLVSFFGVLGKII